jgi:hypothetical protein
LYEQLELTVGLFWFCSNLIFELLDDLLLLAPGGRTVYCGLASQALTYFTSQGFPCPPKTNLPDHVLDVLAGAVPRRFAGDLKSENEAAPAASAVETQAQLVTAWQTEEKKSVAAPSAATAVSAGKAVEPSSEFAGANWFEQVWWNLYRSLLQQVRGPALVSLMIEMSFHLVAGTAYSSCACLLLASLHHMVFALFYIYRCDDWHCVCLSKLVHSSSATAVRRVLP